MKCSKCEMDWVDTFQSEVNPWIDGKPVCRKCGGDPMVEMVVTIKTYTSWSDLQTPRGMLKKNYDDHAQMIYDRLDWLPILQDDLVPELINNIKSIDIKYNLKKN